LPEKHLNEAASAYAAAGRRYRSYADGDGRKLFDFTGRYGFADREIWTRIDAALEELLRAGRRQIRILDAGCGPGTWLQRTLARALELGFTRIDARGFDISPDMVALAQERAQTHASVSLRLEEGDLREPLAEETGSIDLCLCLYGVLNHIPRAALNNVAAELVRVTGGHLFVTARTVGSLPTIFVDAVEKARHFVQDHEHDRFEVELEDGRRLAFPSHLFCATELRALFQPHITAAELVGLDVFHSRFMADPRWNPDSLPHQDEFERQLCKLERLCSGEPAFIDRAAHILLHARPSQYARSGTTPHMAVA
jgi:SAM-dependent methyltransferase